MDRHGAPSSWPFVGAVLCGGASSRMGRDKALIDLEGRPLALWVASALREAGAREVVAVGGNSDALAAWGIATVRDERPHEGPLGAIITALGVASEEILVVVACDMPWIRGSHVQRLTAAMDEVEVEVVLSGANGRVEPLLSAWKRGSVVALRSLFQAGERSPQRAAQSLTSLVLDLGEGAWSRDLDTPDDLRIATTCPHPD